MVKRDDGTTVTEYTVDISAGLPVVLVEDDGTTVTKYTYGDDLLKVSRGGEYYYFYDGLGSTRTIADSTGTPVAQYVYDPYGKLIADGATWNNFLFTGQMLDRTTKLYYLRARWYDPQTGRFVSRDSTMFRAGYSYCSSEPINRVDPNGKDFSIGGCLTTMSIGAALGGITSAVADVAMGRAITVSSVLTGAGIGAVIAPLAIASPLIGAGLAVTGVASSGVLAYQVLVASVAVNLVQAYQSFAVPLPKPPDSPSSPHSISSHASSSKPPKLHPPTPDTHHPFTAREQHLTEIPWSVNHILAWKPSYNYEETISAPYASRTNVPKSYAAASEHTLSKHHNKGKELLM
ncbi:MAG: RHS repeat-associated core domain-containing protein [Armatimonadota bacterium]